MYDKHLVDLVNALSSLYNCNNVAVAGGHCRDLAHGYAPRDADIVIVNVYTPNMFNLESALPEGWVITDVFDSDGPQYADGRPDLEKRLDTVIKLVYELELPAPAAPAVDLLFAKPKYKSVESFVDGFDYNLNMFYCPASEIANTGKIGSRLTQKALDSVSGPQGRVLVQNREAEVTFTRAGYIKDKAELYGWTV